MADASRVRTVRGQLWFLMCLGVACAYLNGGSVAIGQPPFGVPFGEDAEPLGVSGLQSLLPSQPPRGLQKTADYTGLNSRWQPLGNSIADEIVKFYDKTPESFSAQRQALQTLLEYADDLREASLEETDREQQAKLLFLSGQLQRKAALLYETLKTLEKTATQSPLLAARIHLDNLEFDLSNWKAEEGNSDGWTKYLGLVELDKSLNPKADEEDEVDEETNNDEADEEEYTGPVISTKVGSRKAVEATRERLRPLASHSAEVREILTSQPMTQLADALETLLAQWDAATDSKNESIARYQKLRAIISRENPEDEYDLLGFLPTISDYERARIGRRVNGQMAIDIQTEYQQVSDAAGDAANSLGLWLRRTYFNYDTHTTIFEGDLQNMADRRDRQVEPVREVVDGAQVSGQANTETTTTIDVVPNESAAEVHLLVNGVTNSQTVGEKCQIRVRNAGRADFDARKPIFITPNGFETTPAVAGARAGNTPFDAQTPISCLPVFGTALENFALNQARQKIPESNAMARRRVVSRLQERLDQEVGDGLAEGETTLREGQLARLEKYDLHPKAAHYRSTDTLVFLTNRSTRSDEFGGGEMPLDFVEPTGITLHAHESALTAFLDRANLENRTLDEKGLRAEFERYFSDLFGQDFDFAVEETDPDEFTFFEQDNLRVIVENGEVYVLFRAKFEVEENVSPQLISVPFQLIPDGENIQLRRGKGREIFAETLPEYEENDDVRKNQRSGVLVSTGVRNQLEKSIPETNELTRFVEVKMQDKPTRYFIRRITAANGWLSIWLIPEDEASAVIASEANQTGPLPEAPTVEAAPVPES